MVSNQTMSKPIAVACASVLLLFVVGGCDLYNKKAPPEKDVAAKSFAPEDGKAVIYIYRPSSLVAVIQAFRLYLDGSPVVDCTSGTFIRRVAEPGKHAVGVGNVSSAAPSEESVTVEAIEGKLYYVELTVGASPISGRPKLRVVEEQAAQAAIRECTLIE